MGFVGFYASRIDFRVLFWTNHESFGMNGVTRSLGLEFFYPWSWMIAAGQSQSHDR